MYVPVVTLKTKQNIELKKLLSKTFKRSVVWNQYKSKIQTVTTGVGAVNTNTKRILLDSSFQGVSRLLLVIQIMAKQDLVMVQLFIENISHHLKRLKTIIY